MVKALPYSIIAMLLLVGCCCRSPLDGGRRPQVLPDPVCCDVIDYDCVCEGDDSFYFGDDEDSQNIQEDQDERQNRDGREDGDDQKDQKNQDDQKNKEYRIALGDVLEISLLEEDEIFVDGAVVAPDGNIYFAFIEAIPAVGRTVEALTSEIEQKLEKYFLHPIITITPKIANAQVFKIFGRVRRPGVYSLNTEISLREAIAIAGDLMTESFRDKDSDSDLLPLADLGKSYLVRDGKKLPVDFARVLYDPNNNQNNIPIHAGDFIYIAPNEISNVYILGAVYNPTRVTWRRDLTFMELLGVAGGWRYSSIIGANLESVLLVRGPLECPCAMCIDITRILDGSARDLLLQPGDIIYVHNKTLRFGRFLVRVAINSFLQSFGYAAGSYYGIEWFNFSHDLNDNTEDSSE